MMTTGGRTDRVHSAPMDELIPFSDDEPARWYEIAPATASTLRRWVVSTPWTRDICNHPELLGWRYTNHLRRGVAAALKQAPFAESVSGTDHRRLCVLNVLRGGLNFGLRDALHDAFGCNVHPSVFLSSQRFHDGVEWRIREDSYRKLAIPNGAVLFLGDVVATGVTAAHGFEVLFEHLAATDTSLRSLVFFTIGGVEVERVVTTFGARCREAFDDFRDAHVVYVEGRFTVAGPSSELPLALAGTDLIGVDALLAPEFVASHESATSAPLERCAIYDAGSRAFDVPEYLGDVVDYWTRLRGLADDGLRLDDLADLRWPSAEDSSGSKRTTAINRQAWRERLLHHGADSTALAHLCTRRIAALEAAEDAR